MRNAILALFGVSLIAAFLGDVAALVVVGDAAVGGVAWGRRDASGLARVRMAAAEVAVVRDLRGRSGFLDAPTAQELELLERQGEDPTDAGGMRRALRYTEGVLELDEEVTALGAALPGDERCRLVLDAPPGGRVLVTDEPSTVRSASPPPAP